MFRLLIIIVLSFFFKGLQAQNISNIETTKSWYHFYDETGKLAKTISTSQGELMGYSTSFYILKQGSFFKTYDVQGKCLHNFPVHEVGEILSVTGTTFTSRRGSWIYTWSKEGRKIKTRAAK
jgi:hypothetical protein